MYVVTTEAIPNCAQSERVDTTCHGVFETAQETLRFLRKAFARQACFDIDDGRGSDECGGPGVPRPTTARSERLAHFVKPVVDGPWGCRKSAAFTTERLAKVWAYLEGKPA